MSIMSTETSFVIVNYKKQVTEKKCLNARDLLLSFLFSYKLEMQSLFSEKQRFHEFIF